jgi:hypothetical protein
MASGDESDDNEDGLSEPDDVDVDVQGRCTFSPVYSHLNSILHYSPS